MKTLLLVLTLLGAGKAWSIPIIPDSVPQTASSSVPAEQILGYSYGSDGVVFQVNSGGCTRKDDFVVKQGKANGYRTISLARQTADTCLAYYAYGTQIHFTYEELGISSGERFKIINSLEISQRDPF